MMSSRFFPLSVLTVALFLSSCNGSDEKANTDKTSSDTTATTTATAEPVTSSTIVSTPQNMLLVRHKVANFNKWKVSYDAHDSMRLANGVHSYVIGRGVEDSNMVLVSLKADDMAKAKAFAANPSLKEAMQKGGVTGKPSMSYVIVTFQDTAVVNSALRSLTTYSVKDWDAWQKAFADGKQERMDNGIIDRAYGHEMDANDKITLVTAIMDTAKASAYWKSDMLKKRRIAAGVIGQPERFVFRIVQRY